MSENMLKALALICQAKKLIEKDNCNDGAMPNFMARACDEALDAIQYVISAEENKAEDCDSEYVFEHLFKAILAFCDHYSVGVTDTLIHSGYFTHGAIQLLADHGWTEMPREKD